MFHYGSAGHHRGSYRMGPKSFLLPGLAGVYAHIRVAEQQQIRKFAEDPDSVDQITTSQPGE